MYTANYEPHTHADPAFPIIFHYDHIERNANFLTHWHESIEILSVVSGEISVLSDAGRTAARAGETVIVNSNHIHHIRSEDASSEYFCLIADREFCAAAGIGTDGVTFRELVRDKKINGAFREIKTEYTRKLPLYKAVIKAKIAELMIYLYRNYTVTAAAPPKVSGAKTEAVKKTITYIQRNFSKAVSTFGAAREVGLSEAYLCRIFKEITGYTVISYLNFLRCSNARALFLTEKYTVGEVAFLCGFENLSYFSKVYKHHIGCSPSAYKKPTPAAVPAVSVGVPKLYFTDFA
jgi:AraC-like DNA-binding protein